MDARLAALLALAVLASVALAGCSHDADGGGTGGYVMGPESGEAGADPPAPEEGPAAGAAAGPTDAVPTRG